MYYCPIAKCHKTFVLSFLAAVSSSHLQKQSYTLSLVSAAAADNHHVNSKTVSRVQWWEVLCLINALPSAHIESIIKLLNVPAAKVSKKHVFN